jgi:hypothetical protein
MFLLEVMKFNGIYKIPKIVSIHKSKILCNNRGKVPLVHRVHFPACYSLTSQLALFCVLISLWWHIKFPWTFKFVTASFNFIIFAPFLKCSISIVSL